MKYRIKLYGHTSADPETFCTNLADALDVGMEESKLLLRQAPVTIADEIGEEEAESLQNRLTSIKALFILEPTSEETAYQGPEAAEALFPSEDLAAPPFRLPKDDSLRWLAWTGVLAVLAGILLLFIVAAFTSTYLKLEHDQPRSPMQEREIRKSSEGPSEDQVAAEKAELAENIINRIDSLEREIPNLQAKLKEALDDINYPNRRSTMVDLKNEIRARQSEIQSLKVKLQGITGVYEER